jgi:hypothetical protein
VLGLLLIAVAVATAFLSAAAARFSGLVPTLLAAYLAFVAEIELVTLALSPVREATRGGLAVAEGLLLAAAFATWRLRGRPPLPLARARTAVRQLAGDPCTSLFVLVVVLALVYELLLAASPPNNGDSLTYHLTKAAAWAQHGGYYWIPNAPEIEVNEYQPLAEQQTMFFFVTTGSGALYAAPQFFAELAILVAVYGSARRLGFEVRAAVCSACLLATFSIVALEAVTAQVDLVAASFPAAAACLLLDGGPLEAALAGAAVAFALGTKLTTALVLPFIVALAVVRGRRFLAPALVGGLVAFAAIGSWGYLLNALHTGDPLGAGTSRIQFRGTPSYPGSVANAFYLAYGLMDLSVLSNRLIDVLAFIGLAAALVVARWTLRRANVREALADAARIALPFLAPLLVLAGAALVAFVAGRSGFPIRGPNGMLAPLDANLSRTYTRFANEDYSAYGPIGIVALLTAAALAFRAYAEGRADAHHLTLASALPLFLLFISLGSTWHVFLIRFFLLPAVLAGPLLARLFHDRATTAAYLVVATLTIGLTLTHDEPKPLSGRHGWGTPWNLTQLMALRTNSDNGWADTLTAYRKLVPPHACVGAILEPDQPAYLLYGSHLQHHIDFLSPAPAVLQAQQDGLSYVVLSAGSVRWGRWATADFRKHGWSLRHLTGMWTLATKPGARTGVCPAHPHSGTRRAPPLTTRELVSEGYPPVVGLPNQSLYLLDRGVYRRLPDPAVMTARGITLADVVWLPDLPLPQGRTLG